MSKTNIMGREIALTCGLLAACCCYVSFPDPVLAVETRVGENPTSITDGSGLPDSQFQVTVEITELIDGKHHPVDRHLVIFKDDRAYDFALVAPYDVTVVDWKKSRLALLSREQNVQSSIPLKTVQDTAAQMRVFAKKNDLETRLGISAQPQRRDDGSYKLSFPKYDYTATTTSNSSAAQAAQFSRFTDAVAMLNLTRHRGAPPFARMTLGKAIAASSQLPATVNLVLESEGRQRTLTSEYTLKQSLTKEAEDRVEKTAEMMTLYRDVPIHLFP